MTASDRLVAHLRRMAAVPGRLTVAAGILGTAAMVEVLIRIGPRTDVEGREPREIDEPVVDGPTSLLLALVSTAPVAFAATWPFVATLPITGAIFLIISSGRPLPVAAIIAIVLSAYSVGLRRTGVHAALVVAPYALAAIMQPWPFDISRLVGVGSFGAADQLGLVALLGVVFAAVAAGRARKARAETAARDATERALADTLLDHAARGERARIARELHDVVAHHISMISVQAETARLTTPGLPPEGARQLTAIGETARSALAEMRRLLGVLREDAGSTPALAPQPGLRQINDLIDEARASTGVVRLTVRGAVTPLDPGIELTAYRVVQEALTNARRHAPGAEVDVELAYGADALRVLVRDNGPGPGPQSRTGHGMLGMRERVAASGGTLSTGPGPLGGYLVSAVLPIAGA